MGINNPLPASLKCKQLKQLPKLRDQRRPRTACTEHRTQMLTTSCCPNHSRMQEVRKDFGFIREPPTSLWPR